MKFKELVTVLDNNAYLNIVSEKGQWLYDGKVIRNEFFIITED